MARERPTRPSVSQDLAVQAVGAKGRDIAVPASPAGGAQESRTLP